MAFHIYTNVSCNSRKYWSCNLRFLVGIKQFLNTTSQITQWHSHSHSNRMAVCSTRSVATWLRITLVSTERQWRNWGPSRIPFECHLDACKLRASDWHLDPHKLTASDWHLDPRKLRASDWHLDACKLRASDWHLDPCKLRASDWHFGDPGPHSQHQFALITTQ